MKYILILPTILMLLAPFGASAASVKATFVSMANEVSLDSTEQSACIEDMKGFSVLSHNSSMRVIPASVSKLYVFDWALSELPIDFRYTTEFYLDGKTLYINGGGDPHFVVSHLRSIMQKIYAEKSVLVDTFVFSPNFYFNWQSNSKDVQMSLFRSLKEDAGAPIAPRIRVVIGQSAYDGKGQKYEFQSAPLPVLIKQINDYSTNISADVLFRRLGGPTAFLEYMESTYDVDKDTVSFSTGSGLSGNYTNCDLTLRVLRHLGEQIKENDLALTDIMSMPTVDPGVLKKRLIDKEYAKSLVAKSGFVNFHHSLAGVINTKKGPMYFAVFTDFNDMKKSGSTKAMIDRFVNSVLETYKKSLKSFSYTPDPTIFKNIRISRL